MSSKGTPSIRTSTRAGAGHANRAGSLLEREGEVGLIERGLDDLGAGAGSLLVIEGPAGIGKTRLLAEASALAERRDMRARAARGGPLEREMPFGLARQLFEPILRRASKQERDKFLTGSAELALIALGSEHALHGGDPFAPIHGLYWLLANLAEDRPTVLTLDDVQWADSESLRWLDYIARRLDDIPALVVVGVRAGEPHEPSEIDLIRREAEMVTPQALSAAGVAKLIAEDLGTTPDAVFAAGCHEATSGNPFLLAELIRALRAEGIDPEQDGKEALERVTPTSVARYALMRIGAFGAEAVAVVRAIVVLGGAPQLRHVAELAELDADRTAEVCGILREAEILAAGRPIEFVHPLVRAGIYADLAEEKRSRSHRRAAEILASTGHPAHELAPHLLACAPNGDEWVVTTLRAAAAEAMLIGAHESAERFLRRALREPPKEPLPVRLDLGIALMQSDPFEAPRVLGEVAERAADPRLRIAALREAGFATANEPDWDQAVRHYTALITALPEDEHEQRLIAESQLYCVQTVSSGADESTSRRIRSVAGGEAEAATLGQCLVRQALAFDRFLSCDPVEEVVELASAFPPPPLDLRMKLLVPVFACKILAWSGRWDQARFVMAFLDGVAREQGEVVFLGATASFFAEIDRIAGRLTEAEGAARTALEIANASAPHSLAWWSAVTNLIPTLVARGEIAEAGRIADGLDLSPNYDVMPITPAPLEVRGYLRLAQADVEAGAADLLAFGEEARRKHLNNPAHSPWELELAPALATLGRTAEAEAIVAEAERRARQFGAAHVIGCTLRARGLLEPRTRQIETFRESVALLEAYGPPHELARSLLELGAALRRDGSRSEAREPLRRALELASESGAGGIEDRARDELAAAGSRPRQVMRSGLASLTASELRTAKLAAEGLSNVEIAQRLFVSRKTVEKHLGNAYSKLEVAGRDELAGALGQT